MGIYGKIIDLQKLLQAWEHVKKNRPVCGVDHVTWEQFDNNAKDELKTVNYELKEHRYQCLPVKIVSLSMGEKVREIALYTMRDKTIQQSAAMQLTKVFEPLFSDATFAYRPNRSALIAVERIESAIKSKKYSYVLKTDITGFFDNILWSKLENMLRSHVPEEDVLDLVRQSVLAKFYRRDGEIEEKVRGIHQGSSLAPIFSNVYLMDFDVAMDAKPGFFLRYSDDILCLCGSEAEAKERLAEIQSRFKMLGLEISEKKTKLCSISDGFEFLGYAFNESGKSVSSKAEGKLAERLETAWFQYRYEPIHVRLQRMGEILGGWEQYFRSARKISSILEFVTVSFLIRGKKDLMDLAKERARLHNDYPEVATYLSDVWRENGYSGLEILEVEDVLGIRDYEKSIQDERKSEAEILDDSQIRNGDANLLTQLRAVLESESRESLTELMQIYADLHQYKKAALVSDRITAFDHKENTTNVKLPSLQDMEGEASIAPKFDEEEIEKYSRLFCGREDMYATIDYTNGRKNVFMQYRPLTEEVIRKHLSGEDTVATYVQRPNATARFFVMDIDVSRKVLLEARDIPEKLAEGMKEAASFAQKAFTYFSEKGVRTRIELSGGRGYHIWLFFEEWIPVRYLNMLQDKIESTCRPTSDDITVEFFPNKVRMKAGTAGQCVKLPLGIANARGGRSLLLEDDFSPCASFYRWCDNTPQYSLEKLRRFLAIKTEPQTTAIKEVSGDLSIFGELSANCRSVLEKCSLMRYLSRKAHDAGYLTHFERQSVLYVFAHMGEEGKAFVHKIMSFTMNYQYEVTEKFIRKVPEKPVSCVKLREQYKGITAELGCSCLFKQRKNCYPSPVLHALAQSNVDKVDVTIPTSRTLTDEKKQELTEELSVPKRAGVLVGKIVELKKQARRLEQNVRKHERELEGLFNAEKIESLELDIGLLVRSKREGGYDWRIEI